MSNFNWAIDGSVAGVYLLVALLAGLAVRKYVGRVEDFLVAGREMKLYLGIASLAATEFGIITCMYTAQAGYKYGFAGAVPGIAQFVAMLVIGWTGFCIKPLRESGAMTLPELFEKKFGTFARWLAGVVIVLGGLLNMGVFLKIGGEFLLIVTQVSFGGIEAKYAIMIMMGILLLIVSLYTILGGMLSVLITDFLQFVVMSVGLIAVTIMILIYVGWSDIVAAVEASPTAGFNPFTIDDLGWEFVLFQLVIQTAVTLTWQTVIARVLSAKDARTGMKVYTRTSFYFVCRWMIPGLWGMAALATLGAGAFETLTPAQQEDPSLYAMPLFLSTFVPIGLMGLLVAAMLAADMSTDSSYMLTWGSVIYNDILAPFRRNPTDQKRGLAINRLIVAVIGLYLFVFGLVYQIEGNVWDYLTLTGSIYLSSMSVLLIACCYWNYANGWGAIFAIVGGAVVPVIYLTMQKLPSTQMNEVADAIGPYYSGLAAFAAAALGMILGSMIRTKNPPFSKFGNQNDPGRGFPVLDAQAVDGGEK